MSKLLKSVYYKADLDDDNIINVNALKLELRFFSKNELGNNINRVGYWMFATPIEMVERDNGRFVSEKSVVDYGTTYKSGVMVLLAESEVMSILSEQGAEMAFNSKKFELIDNLKNDGLKVEDREYSFDEIKSEIFKKYELCKCSGGFGDRTMYQVRALKDFETIDGEFVEKGDLGGFVESEANLSQEGRCWIADDAIVENRAKISGNALVKNKALVWSDAEISNQAILYGDAVAGGSAWVCGSAKVGGETMLHDRVQVGGSAKVSGKVEIFDEACVCDDAIVNGEVWIKDSARIDGCAEVYGGLINGKMHLCEGEFRENLWSKQAKVKDELIASVKKPQHINKNDEPAKQYAR